MDPTVLRAAWLAGRQRHPRAALDEAAFGRRLEAMAVAPGDLAERPEELYLAAACLQGDPAALAEFDGRYVGAIPRHVARFRLSDTQVAELQQDLRVRLLSGPAPRLATYAGRAPLEGWLRVIALRAALDLLRSRDSVERDAPTLDDLVATYSSPETKVVRLDLRPALHTALNEGFALLSPQDRTILRLHFVDDLSIDAIGRVFRVHRATAARWLVAIRTRLFEHVRERLALDLTPSPSELRSIFRLVKSDLRLSVDRLLAGD